MADDVVKEKQEEGAKTEAAAVAAAETTEDPAVLKQQLEQERAKSAEYLDNWRRAAADLSNYRKHAEKDMSEFIKAANSLLIVRLLPVLDDLERALKTIPDNLRLLSWIDGVILIERKLRAILEAEGLTPIEALNKPFDPNIHEAVIHEETDQHEEGIVIAELQKGYKLNDKILRPTLVKVAKKKNQGG